MSQNQCILIYNYIALFSRPERDALEEQHQEIMNVLNKQMANKAVAQIKLNETRDKLRDTNQAVKFVIVDIRLPVLVCLNLFN